MGEQIMSIAEEINSQVEDIKAQVASQTMSAEDGATLLSELHDAYKGLDFANKAIAMKYIIQAIHLLSLI